MNQGCPGYPPLSLHTRAPQATKQKAEVKSRREKAKESPEARVPVTEVDPWHHLDLSTPGCSPSGFHLLVPAPNRPAYRSWVTTSSPQPISTVWESSPQREGKTQGREDSAGQKEKKMGPEGGREGSEGLSMPGDHQPAWFLVPHGQRDWRTKQGTQTGITLPTATELVTVLL